MRVGFIIPDQRFPFIMIHYGIACLVSYAQSKNAFSHCEVIRTSGLSQEELRSFLKKDWDVLGISITWGDYSEARDLARIIKQHSPRTVLIVGGAWVTTYETDVFEVIPEVDCAVIGEGEVTLVGLLECLKNKKDLSSVPGLLYRNRDKSIIQNPPRQFEANLDNFPIPERSVFTYPIKQHALMCSRGCVYACTFCNTSAVWGHRYRMRSLDHIRKEIQSVVDLNGNKTIFVVNDDAFNIHKERTIQLCRLFREFGISYFLRGVRVDLITEEIADVLMNTGCCVVACGMETGNEKVLKGLDKKFTVKKILQGTKLLQKRHIEVIATFMIGNHNDTFAAFKDSLDCSAFFDNPVFTITYPMPKTYLYEFVKKNGYFLKEPILIEHEGQVIDKIVFATPWFSAQERLKAVHMAIEHRIYNNIIPPPLSYWKENSQKFNRFLRRLSWNTKALFG